MTTFNKALNRVHLVQEALALGRPFSILTLGYGTSAFYQQGVLCYLCGNYVRVLNVHGGENSERVIDARGLAPRVGRLPIKFTKVVHYHDDFLSIEYATDVGRRLVCFDISSDLQLYNPDHNGNRQPYLGTVIVLRTKYFVRGFYANVILGESFTRHPHGHHEWSITCTNILDNTTSPTLRLTNLFGTDMGKNVCFEVFDGIFYAVSSMGTNDDEEIDWSSFYLCYRVPATNVEIGRLEHRKIWRRQHREGPLNDSFTNLSLQKDTKTGAIMIVEARQEYLSNGQSEQTRTWYFTRLSFDDEKEDSSTNSVGNTAIAGPSSIPSLAGLPPSGLLPPNDPLVNALDAKSKPQYERARPRTFNDYHVDPKHDEHGAPRRRRRPSQVRYRTYDLATSTSLDLLYDEECLINGKPQLRLQHGSRVPASPLSGATGRLHNPMYDNNNLVPNSIDRYQARPVKMWPPLDAPAELFEFLNPMTMGSPHKGGNVSASTDGSSLIYMSGHQHTTIGQAIVLVNFDPAIKFGRLPRMDLGTPTQLTEVGEAMAVNVIRGLHRSGASFAEGWATRVAPGVVGPQEPYVSEERAWWVQMRNGFELIH